MAPRATAGVWSRREGSPSQTLLDSSNHNAVSYTHISFLLWWFNFMEVALPFTEIRFGIIVECKLSDLLQHCT